MRDYTTNNYCDFLWINDLIALKKNAKNSFTSNVKKNNSSTPFTISNVTLFGRIVEVKQIGSRGFLYQVDDGTGVIACKHNEDQFEEVISLIENEQYDILNQTVQSRQYSEQSSMTDHSLDDSIFNDKSIQNDEVDVNKKNRLLGLHSIWDDIYQSFASLIEHYNIGDFVFIEGKLYNYFNVNQVYVNSIRPMDLSEEIIKASIKLEDSYDLSEIKKPENDKRMSGLMTFDHIHHLNARFPSSRNINSPKPAAEVLQEQEEVVTPHLSSTITFDTFGDKI